MADVTETTEYLTRVAPQCVSDILIQIFPDDNQEKTVFAFTLGSCLYDWIEGHGCLDGIMELSDEEKSMLLRAALHLERHARMIRDTLSGPICQPEDRANAP